MHNCQTLKIIDNGVVNKYYIITLLGTPVKKYEVLIKIKHLNTT